MNAITISKKLTKGEELVVISRKQYERFLSILEKYSQLDQDLDKSIRQAKRSDAIGHFNSAEELKRSLEK